MAQIQDHKSDFYSHKQSVRDESLAPAYLESAGDLLIRDLAKKQLQTNITLEQQLEVSQNFEKGPEIQPNLLKGVKSLEEFKQEVGEEAEEDDGKCMAGEEVIHDLEDLKKATGLSRRELELSLSEKPNSTISKLYHFAVASKKKLPKEKPLEAQLLDHPINHLKEIEEEYFGHLKRAKKSDEPDVKVKKVDKPQKKRKRHRKRKKKGSDQVELNPDQAKHFTEAKNQTPSTSDTAEEQGEVTPTKTRSRVSLWDVKDMKKWCEGKEYSCKPQKLFTIKEGKIVELKDVT